MSTTTSQDEHAQVQTLLERFQDTEVSMRAKHRLEGSGGVSRIFNLEDIVEGLFQDATQRGSTYRMKLVIDYLDLSNADLTVLHQVCEEDDRERKAIATMMGSLRYENGRAPTKVFVGNSFAAGGMSTISNQLVKGALFASHIELRRREQLSRSRAGTTRSSGTVQEGSNDTQQEPSTSTGEGTEVSSGDQEASLGSSFEVLRSMTTRLEELLSQARSTIDSTKQNGPHDGAQGSAE